jgi:uncharacterized membrane protein
VKLPWARPRWLDEAQEREVVAAIGRAEVGNRGEVRVHLDARCSNGDALARAKDLFAKLGLDATRDDTGVLLYVAVDDRRAAVYAGKGVFGAGDESVWKDVVDAVARGFAKGDRAAGLCEALDLVGEVLRVRAPGDDDAGNELPNEVSVSHER